MGTSCSLHGHFMHREDMESSKRPARRIGVVLVCIAAGQTSKPLDKETSSLRNGWWSNRCMCRGKRHMRIEAQASGPFCSVAEYFAASECSLAVNSKTSALPRRLCTVITCEGKWMVRNARSQSPATARHITQSALNWGFRKAGSKWSTHQSQCCQIYCSLQGPPFRPFRP